MYMFLAAVYICIVCNAIEHFKSHSSKELCNRMDLQHPLFVEKETVVLSDKTSKNKIPCHLN